MSRIKQLSNELIKQIAAGEVVERPASVVKELLENSIDAHATEIYVDIEDAGSKLIRVRDNGSGIHPEDLALAFSTHATSKIRNFNDLETVLSLGFRGEALPSIASVSKISLTSRAEGFEHASTISPHISMKITPAAHPFGTTVEVRELFYNTPARKKFLKTPKTEQKHIIQLVERIALSHENIRIHLNIDDNKTRIYAGDDLNEKIASILGKEFIEQSISIEKQIETADGILKISGLLGLPTFNAQNGDKQYLYINKRMIRDKFTSHAIKMAYQDMLYHGRFPIFVLWIDIPPELLDVNAHPQKHEIRYREQKLCHDFIFFSVNQTLRSVRPHQNEISKNVENISVNSLKPEYNSQKASLSNSLFQNNFSNNAMSRKKIENSLRYFAWAADKNLDKKNHSLANQEQNSENENSLISNEHNFQLNQNDNINQSDIKSVLTNNNQLSVDTETMPLGRALGQIHNIFIIAENSIGLLIVDMHAAHERILYEKFKSYLHGTPASMQKLLLAQTLHIDPAQEELINQHSETLSYLGYQWEIENSVLLIKAVPEILKYADHSAIFADLLNELAIFPNSEKIEILKNNILATICCHSAVRAHRKLSLIEMNQLLRDIEITPSAGQCNHGRPTWVQLTEKELGNLFMRGK